MASLLTRFTTFIPNTTILSGDHNQELNRIVNLLAGVTTNLKTSLKTSDAGDPPLELDQLSTGPILKLFQGGILKAQINNAGNFLFNQSGGFIGDQNANEYLKFATVASAVNELEISNAATAGRPKIAATGGDANIDLELAGKGTGLIRLPASSPTDDSHAARKKYIDDRKVSFIVGFPIVDPANANTGVHEFGSLVIPGGGVYTITKLKLMFRDGSHTSGGDITFTFDRSGVGDIGSIDLDNTNNTAGVVYVSDIGDITPSENEIFSVRITARSGTITEKGVMAMIEGHRTAFN